MIKLSKKFWNELESKYPSAVEHFYTWVHAYKHSVGWNQLFSNQSSGQPVSYVDLPIAMQIGIFLQYAAEQGQAVSISQIGSLKEFYQVSGAIESFMATHVPTSAPVAEDSAAIFNITRTVINFLPDADGSQPDHFEGGGGDFGGGGASGKY